MGIVLRASTISASARMASDPFALNLKPSPITFSILRFVKTSPSPGSIMTTTLNAPPHNVCRYIQPRVRLSVHQPIETLTCLASTTDKSKNLVRAFVQPVSARYNPHNISKEPILRNSLGVYLLHQTMPSTQFRYEDIELRMISPRDRKT